MKEPVNWRGQSVFLPLYICLMFLGCASLKTFPLDQQWANFSVVEKGQIKFSWEEDWIIYGSLKWHNHENFLYVDEAGGRAKGTFGKIENYNNYYHLKPFYRFKVREPDMIEKEVLLRLGTIEDEEGLKEPPFLEACWTGEATFKPGSKVVTGSVMRGYEIEKMDVPTKCIRKTSPY